MTFFFNKNKHVEVIYRQQLTGQNERERETKKNIPKSDAMSDDHDI